MIDVKELLNRTMQCPTCAGKGLIENKEATGGSTACETCNGSGIVLDCFITDLMIKNGIKGRAMTEFAEKVFEHYGDKLRDAYNRGVEDGKGSAQDTAGKGTGA